MAISVAQNILHRSSLFCILTRYLLENFHHAYLLYEWASIHINSAKTHHIFSIFTTTVSMGTIGSSDLLNIFQRQNQNSMDFTIVKG
jgi:hypothetical protein